MPSTITLGHLLMRAGLVAASYGAWQIAAYLRQRCDERGAPRYAHSPTPALFVSTFFRSIARL